MLIQVALIACISYCADPDLVVGGGGSCSFITKQI